MALTFKDRVLETSTSTGTGDFVLLGAQTGYQTFSVVGNGATVTYTIQNKNPDGSLQGEWEVGKGTYYSSGNYITRDTVYESSNGNNKVTFAAGAKDVFLDLPGEQIVQGPASATNNNLVVYDGITGKVLKDSGYGVGQPNGVASLDSSGKVPTSELPAMGNLQYQGSWNASTNTPTLTSGTGTQGYYYVVSVAGTTNLNGITDWGVGDWAIFNGTVWQKIDNSDAGGDVVGPSSSTDNAIARFDLTTGKLIQNSVGILSDSGALSGITTITDINYVDFNTGYSTTLGAGQLGWNGNDTLGLGMIGGNVVQHIGEDQFFYCKATSAITKGQVVMFTGAVGASGVPTGAPATGITDGTYIMGVAAENIALNGFGLVQCFGTLRNVNTTGYADGDILWYNPAVAGGLTKTKPTAPNVKAQIAAVINGGSSGGGTILIRITPGSILGGTDSNAEIGSPTNGQILTYDYAGQYWKNTSLTAGTAISVSAGIDGTLTITNSAPDQTVSLTAGTGISTSGTYPNFTITNTAPDQIVSLTAGSNVTITGTYPNFTIASTASGGVTTFSAGTTGFTPSTATSGAVTLSGTLNAVNGGTGISSYAVGEMLFANTTTSLDKVTANSTTTKKFLSQTGTGTAGQAPTWDTLPTVLPVLNRSGSTVSVSVGNGVLPVLTRAGSTVDVAIN